MIKKFYQRVLLLFYEFISRSIRVFMVIKSHFVCHKQDGINLISLYNSNHTVQYSLDPNCFAISIYLKNGPSICLFFIKSFVEY